MPTDAIDRSLTPEDHRRLGIDLFNHARTLLEKPDRTAAETDELIHCAHASRYHWGEAAGREAFHLDRGEWLCSRVYSVLRRAEPALWHARRCLEICEREGIGDWDIAFAYEALARANRVAGDATAGEHWLARAREAGSLITEADDRELLFTDLATV